jgi:HPt (histidine-containing phosphotransfer) domain-containing protein
MTDPEDKTASLLTALWLRVRPLVEERLATLDRAAASTPLTEELRKEAASSAHKLAGSLGMYGYDEGTRIARKIELLFDSGTPERKDLGPLIAELRGAVFPDG